MCVCVCVYIYIYIYKEINNVRNVHTWNYELLTLWVKFKTDLSKRVLCLSVPLACCTISGDPNLPTATHS